MVNDHRMHPDDLELLDLVEGDLPRDRADEVAAHVERCTVCERAVRELQAGRAATHTATRLQLSPEARDRITVAIGLERQHPRRSLFDRLVPVVAVLAAVLVLGSVVGVIGWGISRSGGGDDSGGGDVAASAGGGQDEAAADTGSEPEADEGVVATVAGTPRSVARALRRDGFEARVAGNRVIVRNATSEAVQESLAGRKPGPVRVVLRP